MKFQQQHRIKLAQRVFSFCVFAHLYFPDYYRTIVSTQEKTNTLYKTITRLYKHNSEFPLCQVFNVDHSDDTEEKLFAFCLSLLEEEERSYRLISVTVETWKYFNHFSIPSSCTLITSPSPQRLISNS